MRRTIPKLPYQPSTRIFGCCSMCAPLKAMERRNIPSICVFRRHSELIAYIFKLNKNRGALRLLTAQKHARKYLSRPQNARRSRCLDRWLRVCHGWCHFQKSSGTVRSRFCKNRSAGYVDVAPSSEKWLEKTLPASHKELSAACNEAAPQPS